MIYIGPKDINFSDLICFRSYSSRPYSTYSRSNRDDKVSEAVGQMVSMGFTDEDGWLTQLCTLKKGNIEQVLDVLTPVKK